MMTTQTIPDRNPDVDHKEDTAIPASLIPPGCYLHEGKQLMLTARSAKVPYGTARKRTYIPNTTDSRMETVGLIIRETDRARFAHALANKGTKNKSSSPRAMRPVPIKISPQNAMPFAVIKLTDLKTLRCRDKDEVQDTLRQLRAREIRYIVLKWSEDAGTWIQLEAHE